MLKELRLADYKAKFISYDVKDRIATIALSYPEHKNPRSLDSYQFGFSNPLSEPERLLADSPIMARELADDPNFGYAMTKPMLWQEWSHGLGECIETQAPAPALCMHIQGFARAYHAFIVKQKRVFGGN